MLDFTQIKTLAAYQANREAIDAFLARKSTDAAYQANQETIGRLVDLKDYEFISESLKMTKWYHRDGGGAWAYCSRAFWYQWRRDRIQIDKRILQVEKRNGRYALYTYREGLVNLLLSE